MSDKSATESPVLAIEGLRIRYGAGTPVVSDLDMAVGPGEVVGVIGESGCGKSTVALSVLGLLHPSAERRADRFDLVGQDLLGMPDKELNRHRGLSASMIFQEPMTALNPCMRIGRQIGEMLQRKLDVSRRDARERSVELLRQVEVPRPDRRVRQYPHELSGGMRQRVMIAMAMALQPKLLIADEPTTALDVTIQAQILDLLAQLQSGSGTSLLLISHDLGVVANMCSRIVVMYAGQVVEEGPTDVVLARPSHPYTWALLHAVPRLDRERDVPLVGIPGRVTEQDRAASGCRFQPRCRFAEPGCTRPQVLQAVSGSSARCWKAGSPGWLEEEPDLPTPAGSSS